MNIIKKPRVILALKIVAMTLFMGVTLTVSAAGILYVKDELTARHVALKQVLAEASQRELAQQLSGEDNFVSVVSWDPKDLIYTNVKTKK